jgi:hypothetical protein
MKEALKCIGTVVLSSALALGLGMGTAYLWSKPVASQAPALADNIAATVRIRTGRSRGSGVVVGPHEILTAAHCVTGQKECSVDIFGATGFLTVRGRVVQSSEYYDLALIHVDCALPTPVKLASPDIAVGTPCTAIGATAGHTPHNVTAGFFSGKSVAEFDEVRPGLWQVSCNGYPGNSGCGVYVGGELIGIVIWGNSPCTMFLVPVYEVSGFLKECGL